MDDLQRARKYLKKSKSFIGHFFKNDYIDLAIRYYTTGLMRLKEDQDHKHSIIACLELINTIISLKSSDKLREYSFLYITILEMLAKIYLKIDDIENCINYYYILINHLENTEHTSKCFVNISKNILKIGQCYTIIASLTNDINQKIQLYKNAVEKYTINSNNTFQIRKIYEKIAESYAISDDYVNALFYYNKVVDIYKTNHHICNQCIANIYVCIIAIELLISNINNAEIILDRIIKSDIEFFYKTEYNIANKLIISVKRNEFINEHESYFSKNNVMFHIYQKLLQKTTIEL